MIDIERQQAAADEVKAATERLNAAINAAVNVGVMVRIDVETSTVMGQAAARPLVTARVSRPL